MASKHAFVGGSLVLLCFLLYLYSHQIYDGSHYSMRQLKSASNEGKTHKIEGTGYIREQIALHNKKQKIYNAESFGPDISLVIVIQVHNRLLYLEELIRSLSLAAEITKALLIFSHDVYDDAINKKIQDIQFCKVMQIFYPFSIQTHPDTFPGPEKEDCSDNNKISRSGCKNKFYKDTYGHYRSATLIQTKHHWWWKINYVLYRLPVLMQYSGLILLLEEDHYLAADFIYALRLMQHYANSSCSECGLFSLGFADSYDFSEFNQVLIGNHMENLGLAFNRSTFEIISQYSEEFCKFDDYNWDMTLQYVLNGLMNPTPLSMVMKASRVCHIGKCGTHFNSANCSPGEIIRNYQNQQSMGSLFPRELLSSRKKTSISTKNNGGWGDPRDHALCMAM